MHGEEVENLNSVIPGYLWGIGSRTPLNPSHIPKSVDAQVPYISNHVVFAYNLYTLNHH